MTAPAWLVRAIASIAALLNRPHRCPHGIARCTADNLCADCWEDRQW